MGKTKAEKRLEKKFKKQSKSLNDSFAHSPIQKPSNDDNDTLVFSFRDLQDEYDFSQDCCTDQVRKDLLSSLRRLSQTTWDDLITRDKKNGGSELINKSEIKAGLPSFITDDYEKLIVVRFNSQSSRLIGYRQGNVFYVLFIDVKLTLYDH